MAPENRENFAFNNTGNASPRVGANGDETATRAVTEAQAEGMIFGPLPHEDTLNQALHNLQAIVENTPQSSQWHRERHEELRQVKACAKGYRRALIDLGEATRRGADQRRRAESYEKDALDRVWRLDAIRSLLINGQFTSKSFREAMQSYFRLPEGFSWEQSLKGEGRGYLPPPVNPRAGKPTAKAAEKRAH